MEWTDEQFSNGQDCSTKMCVELRWCLPSAGTEAVFYRGTFSGCVTSFPVGVPAAAPESPSRSLAVLLRTSSKSFSDLLPLTLVWNSKFVIKCELKQVRSLQSNEHVRITKRSPSVNYTKGLWLFEVTKQFCETQWRHRKTFWMATRWKNVI